MDKVILDETGKKFVLSKPPEQVFLGNTLRRNEHTQQKEAIALPASQNELVPMLDMSKGYNGVTYPETGGMYVWHVGREHPRKGHVYPEALRDTYYPKAILASWAKIVANKDMFPFFLVFALLPKKWKGKVLTRIIDGYLDISDEVLQDHYLHPQFNIDICRALSQVIMDFFIELGVDKYRSAKVALVIITLLEYDMAYRLRIEDLLSETTKEKLLADPVGEAQRLIKILAERDWTRPHLVEKFNRFARLMRYGFFFIRKPFRKALAPVRFSLLQLDEIDRFHVRHWSGYNWFGMTIEERVAKWPPVPSPAFRLVPDDPASDHISGSQTEVVG